MLSANEIFFIPFSMVTSVSVALCPGRTSSTQLNKNGVSDYSLLGLVLGEIYPHYV